MAIKQKLKELDVNKKPERVEESCKKGKALQIFLLYFACNVILLIGHEQWRDEANVWLIARELSPFALLRELKYQGHPCLWYFLVMPFAKLHLPFQTISVLSFLIMAIAGGMFAVRAPFRSLVKAALLVSPVFTYYYPVVARNYCLIALILILLADLYPTRNEKPIRYGLLLALLVQADTIALAPAGLIWLWWLWEFLRAKKTRDRWIGLLLPILSLFLLFAEFYGVSKSAEYDLTPVAFSELPMQLKNNLAGMIGRMTGTGASVALSIFVFVLTVLLMLSLEKRRLWPFLVSMLSFLYEALFSIVVYQLHIWHYIALAFVLIWSFWVLFESETDAPKTGKQPLSKELPDGLSTEENTASGEKYETVRLAKRLAETALLILAVLMFLRWNAPEEGSSLENALHGIYSDGKNAAAYLRKNVPEDALIFSTDVPKCATVLAYLPRDYEFIYAGSLTKATYADYNDDQKGTISYDELLDFVVNEYRGIDSFYILESTETCIQGAEDIKKFWEICYNTEEETARDEAYTLYRISLTE